METPTHTAPPVALDRLVRRCAAWNKLQGTDHTPETYDEERKTEYLRLVWWDKGWEQSEIENAELRQYAAHALGMLNKLEYEREEDGKGELAATLDLDWFFHVKWRLEQILTSPPHTNKLMETNTNTPEAKQPPSATPCSLSSAALKAWLECEKDTPFFCRRSIDKSGYEVGKQTNDDWRECISEDRIFFGRFATEEEAQAVYDEHRIKWMWEEICKANA